MFNFYSMSMPLKHQYKNCNGLYRRCSIREVQYKREKVCDRPDHDGH